MCLLIFYLTRVFSILRPRTPNLRTKKRRAARRVFRKIPKNERLEFCVERTRDNVHLLRFCQLYEVYRIARNADCKLRVFFGMVHCVEQNFAHENVYVQMLSVFCHVSVDETAEVYNLFVVGLAQRVRQNRERVRYADRKSTRLNSSHRSLSRMPSSA